MKILGIEFAPLSIPLERRLQTLAVVFYVFTFFQGLSFIGITLFIYFLFTKYYWISLLYAIWYYLDRNRSHMGGRTILWFREWSLWKYYKDYFPIELVKTVDLDPNKNYIMGVSPHGVMCFGSMANFGTKATGFHEKFPGLTPHLITLNGQFYSPLMREFFMTCGACACSVESLKYILSNKGQCKQKGQVCALMIGGARESNEAYPGAYKFILKQRKGFIRVALQTGACLVPVISFGENDVYKTVRVEKDSMLKKIQENVKKYLNIGLPIIRGRGIYNYNFGFMPYRIPIHTVVGKPIETQQTDHPTEKQIEELQNIYIQELTKLFYEHKDKYVKDKNVQLEII